MPRIFRALFGLSLLLAGGCARSSHPEAAKAPQIQTQIWGSRGAGNAQFTQPRVITLDAANKFAYVADTTGRVLKWTTGGAFVMAWMTPAAHGNAEGPEGVTMLKGGNIAFADTHGSKILIYSPTGKFVRGFGAYGIGKGQFLLVTGLCSDADGFLYASDYGGDFDRISKWTPDGKLIAEWTGHGEGPRQFRRPCGLAISREGDLLVADTCNHRIQRLDRNSGAYKGQIGVKGRAEGQFNYPYGVAVAPSGNIFTVEFGAHRVQKWSPDGKFLASFGGPGRAPGQFANPWGLTVDKDENVYVADTQNHRIQKFHF